MMLSSKEKVYVVLFTCLQIRAVHLECTLSLSADNLFKAISRFFSRRGIASMFRSDNARTFKFTAERLASSHNLTWKFNTERASWEGGSWEKLVKCVKGALKSSISKVRHSYIDIETLICQIEYIINCRPLTYANGNEEDIIPLSPNNFLIQPNTASRDPTKSTRNTIINTLACSKTALHQFWHRWKTE